MNYVKSSKAVDRTTVLIVGAGASGLTAALMLGRLGIDTIVIERHAGTSITPKAHIIHSRTMEIFAQLGLASEVRAAAAPPEHFQRTAWYTSLGGEDAWDRRLLTAISSWSAGDLKPYYEEVTAESMTNLPQHLLEPIMREHAERAVGDGRILFNNELTALSQSADGVEATVLDRNSGESKTIAADYVIGADGGKTVGDMVGIPMLGPPPIIDIVSIIFKADISAYLQEDDCLIRLFLQPQLDGTTRRFSLVAAGPDRWDRHCGHWRSAALLPVGSDLDAYTPEIAVKELRTLLKLPDLQIEDIELSRWRFESLIAERMQAGRVFLVGDAAHRHSPSGGLGLNTAVQDAHNLAWKLALVVRGAADPALLDSYDLERRPVARRRVEFATFSLYNHLSAGGGFGMTPGASEEHNRAVLEALFSDTADGETRRAQLKEMLYTLRREFQHADLDLGYEYADSPAVVPDGTEAPRRDPVGSHYEPVARPGHRLPHAVLAGDREPVSTHGLLGLDRFLLLCDADGPDWASAAARVAAETDMAIEVITVGARGELRDPAGTWAGLRGHDPGGAVLVRPDGHVAFRALTAPVDAEEELRRAVEVALGTFHQPPSAPDRSADTNQRSSSSQSSQPVGLRPR